MAPCDDTAELDQVLKIFKNSRDELKRYVDTLATKFGETDFTIHEILGASIKSTSIINNLPENIGKFSITRIAKLTSDKLQDIISKCKKAEEAQAGVSSLPNFWKIIRISNINPFEQGEVLKHASDAGKLFASLYTRCLSIYSKQP